MKLDPINTSEVKVYQIYPIEYDGTRYENIQSVEVYERC